MDSESKVALITQVRPGMVYTFYSFKGGVGRSMALANVASLISRTNRVLIIDWDLEAPGLDKFFTRPPSTLFSSREERDGIVDLITAFSRGEELNWRDCIIEASAYGLDDRIAIMPAGRKSSDYVQKVQSLDWPLLFKETDLGRYLERLRKEWTAEYEFVLLDSRTGITDIGGICTVFMPDVLVTLFTTNDQSLEGVIEVVQRARDAQDKLMVDRTRLLVVPVPARDESRTEKELALEWRKIFSERLGHLYRDWLPKEVELDTAIEKLRIPYVPYWSFYERLPVVEEGIEDPQGIGIAYDLLARIMRFRLDWDSATAESLLTKAIAISERSVGSERRETAGALLNLANLYIQTGNLGQAETTLRKALEGAEKILGQDHEDTVPILDRLGEIYETLGRRNDAESFIRRSSAIRARSARKVYISYSHDSAEHVMRVQDLAARLRSDGVLVVIDQDELFPPRGWPVWAQDQISGARFVLVICTEPYQRRAEGREDPGKGLGTTYEASIMSQDLYRTSGENLKFIPVVFSASDRSHIPSYLRHYTYFDLEGEKGYRDLLRLVLGEENVPKLWNIPARNSFFTGRKEFLESLHNALAGVGSAAVTQAIKGMGGIGKTQAAIEYAHRYRSDYRAGFWITADSLDALVSGFAGLAGLMGLPVEQDLAKTAALAKGWLESNSGWLLVLDNVESMEDVVDWIPRAGHVLITTRLQTLGKVASGVNLLSMTPEEGAEFVLQRAKILKATEDDRRAANEIANEVGGLPLALEQASAFIEETQLSLSEYLSFYRKEGPKLRARAGSLDQGSVRQTITLALEKLSNRASRVVYLCAFLAPDAIPEEILTGTEEPDLSFHEAMAEAGKLSLIRRNAADRSVDIHRLVQDVVKDGLDQMSKRSWAERAVEAVNYVFPAVEFQTWPQCGRLLPHARVAGQLIVDFTIESVASARLLNQTANYLNDRARYSEAEPLYRRALAIREKALGRGDPDIATILDNLAVLYYNQGRYQDAEPIIQRALAIRENALGPNHPDTAQSLSNLALLYANQGRYEEAEPLYLRAFAMQEKALGPHHPSTATSLDNLAVLYSNQGRYQEAEPIIRSALAIREETLGPDHPATATSLNNLAMLYKDQGRSPEAEPLYQRALAIREKVVGPDHPDTARSLNDLALLYYDLGRYQEAYRLGQRALDILHKALGPNHPSTRTVTENLALLLRKLGRPDEAQALLEGKQL